MLSIAGLSVSYSGVMAVHDFSLELARGELVTVLGANGAGKTSIMRGIIGVASHRAHKFRFNDQEIIGWKTPTRVEAGITLVPEGREIFPSLTVEENLQTAYDAKRTHSASESDCAARAYDLFPRLSERRNQLAGTMSGGEQQMLAIGRGLMQEPQLLLLDEPSLGLAPIIIDTVMDALVLLNKEGMTMVMVEQNASLALEIASRAIVIRTGQIVMLGTSKELEGSEQLVEAIFGSSEPE